MRPKGFKHSKETIEKIRLPNKGKMPTNLDSLNSPESIMKRTETKRKQAREGTLVIWNRGLKGYSAGEKHHAWRGGITPINKKIRTSGEYKLWRRAVIERDNYACIWCGNTEHLEADHIKPFALFPELRFAIDNGRTLCRECHKKTDNYGLNIKYMAQIAK
jgi:5-methylcytosine-specific restriction endonuclease McrA